MSLNSYKTKLFKSFKFKASFQPQLLLISKKRFSVIRNNLFQINKSLVKLFNKKFDEMIRVRFDNQNNTVAISLKCKLTATSEREFNLNRKLDESIGITFNKLYSNYNKHFIAKAVRLTKKLKKNEEEEENDNKTQTNPESQSNISIGLTGVKLEDKISPNSSTNAENTEIFSASSSSSVPIYLYDLENKLIPYETKNKDAWKDDFLFKIQDQTFTVCVNLPHLTKLNLSKLLIAGMPAIAKIDTDYEPMLHEKIFKNSKFYWYLSKTTFDAEGTTSPPKDELKTKAKTTKAKQRFNSENLEWELFDQGINLKMCVLKDNCENRLVKVECIPSDGKREGIAIDHVSNSLVQKKIDIETLPMTQRHKLTENKLDSNNFRVTTYNVLANCYSDTALAKEHLYTYCPSEYLDFKYRRILLIHEIKNYNSDIIFLQECETDFFEEDIKSSFPDYTHLMRTKGDKTREGEAIIFRSDRFRFIKSFDICIAEELKNNVMFEKLWKSLSNNSDLEQLVAERNTILQVAQVECLDKPGDHLLLANTHLFFHPKADFIRLLQAIVCTKYIEKLKYDLVLNDKNIKQMSILFGGDFNSDPQSYAFTYIFTQSMPHNILNPEDKLMLKDCEEDFTHSLNLSAYADFPFTNCIQGFEGILDYVFYETNAFELSKVIPLPSEERVKENVALPSRTIPSDHLALVFELKLK